MSAQGDDHSTSFENTMEGFFGAKISSETPYTHTSGEHGSSRDNILHWQIKEYC